MTLHGGETADGRGVLRLVRIGVVLVAVLGQLALSWYCLVKSVLVIPLSTSWVLVLACVIGWVVLVWSAVRRPWFAPLVPVIGFVLLRLFLDHWPDQAGWGA